MTVLAPTARRTAGRDTRHVSGHMGTCSRGAGRERRGRIRTVVSRRRVGGGGYSHAWCFPKRQKKTCTYLDEGDAEHLTRLVHGRVRRRARDQLRAADAVAAAVIIPVRLDRKDDAFGATRGRAPAHRRVDFASATAGGAGGRVWRVVRAVDEGRGHADDFSLRKMVYGGKETMITTTRGQTRFFVARCAVAVDTRCTSNFMPLGQMSGCSGLATE